MNFWIGARDLNRVSVDYNILIALLFLAISARVITFGNPALGYDEQFYLLVGGKMLDGYLPYVDIFDRKPVGIFLIYAGAHLFGGDGFLAYKLIALLFATSAACLIYILALKWTGRAGAILAASFYILWLNFMEGEGGQTPIFYNPLVLGAAALLFHAANDPRRLWRDGLAAMGLIGLAIQIKYTVIFEGLFFGLAFLWLSLRSEMAWLQRLIFGAALVFLAILPTLMALAYFSWLGHFDAFVFANFLSVFGQGKSAANQFVNLARVSALFLPIAAFIWLGRKPSLLEYFEYRGVDKQLLGFWLIAAIAGVLIYWRFNSPHYALPILAPLCLFVASQLNSRPRLGAGVAVLAFLAGQIVQAQLVERKGGAAEMQAIAEAARPDKGCIFVYNGYPGLYLMTGSCLPTRWPFPGHLNARDENFEAALGVGAVAETERILASRPDAIVDRFPAFRFGNVAARAAVHRVIAADYHPVLCVRIGGGQTRVVYRRKDDRFPPQIADCPAEVFAPIG